MSGQVLSRCIVCHQLGLKVSAITRLDQAHTPQRRCRHALNYLLMLRLLSSQSNYSKPSNNYNKLKHSKEWKWLRSLIALLIDVIMSYLIQIHRSKLSALTQYCSFFQAALRDTREAKSCTVEWANVWFRLDVTDSLPSHTDDKFLHCCALHCIS